MWCRQTPSGIRAISEILVQTLEDMKPEYPPLNPEDAARIPQILEQLDADRR